MKFKATIARWIDGDTCRVNIDLGFNLWIMNKEVRLSAYDTAETRTKDLEQKWVGLYTKELLEQVFPVGAEVVVISEKQKKGKYGRVLGDIDRLGVRWSDILKDNDLVVKYGTDKETKSLFFRERHGELTSG